MSPVTVGTAADNTLLYSSRRDAHFMTLRWCFSYAGRPRSVADGYLYTIVLPSSLQTKHCLPAIHGAYCARLMTTTTMGACSLLRLRMNGSALLQDQSANVALCKEAAANVQQRMVTGKEGSLCKEGSRVCRQQRRQQVPVVRVGGSKVCFDKRYLAPCRKRVLSPNKRNT